MESLRSTEGPRTTGLPKRGSSRSEPWKIAADELRANKAQRPMLAKVRLHRQEPPPAKPKEVARDVEDFLISDDGERALTLLSESSRAICLAADADRRSIWIYLLTGSGLKCAPLAKLGYSSISVAFAYSPFAIDETIPLTSACALEMLHFFAFELPPWLIFRRIFGGLNRITYYALMGRLHELH